MPQELDLSILERVADYGFAQGPAVGFLANWRKQPNPGPSNTGIRPTGWWVWAGLGRAGPMGYVPLYSWSSNFLKTKFHFANLEDVSCSLDC